MTRFKLLALVAVATFAASSVFADDQDCCAAGASHKNMTAMCEATFAKLDLTVDQKAKMEKLAAECDKGGCTKESMAKMEASAKGILTEKQFAAWKAACSAHHAEKAQS